MTEVYDLLTGVKLQDTTYAQIEEMTERTYVDRQSLEFWKGVFQVSKALEVAKTAPHGLPLPSHSSVQVATINDGESGQLKPSGTEVWLVQAINLDNCTMVITDGTNSIAYASDSEYISRTRNPLILTGTLFAGFNNASGSTQTPSLAVHKLSL
jgi:hypothetical protein